MIGDCECARVGRTRLVGVVALLYPHVLQRALARIVHEAKIRFRNRIAISF